MIEAWSIVRNTERKLTASNGDQHRTGKSQNCETATTIGALNCILPTQYSLSLPAFRDAQPTLSKH